MCVFEIAIEWHAAGRTTTPDEMINIYQSCKVQKYLIMSHVNYIWEDTTFGSLAPDYFPIFNMSPIDTTELEELRNLRKLKHAIMGKNIWNSLTSKYKIEISGKRLYFKRGGYYDGFLL